jgi:hypothetical protein
MKFLSDILAKAGLVVDGVVAFNNTATGLTPSTGDNSTKLATTAFVKAQGYLTTGYVPYTGANSDVNLGVYGLTSTAITAAGDLTTLGNITSSKTVSSGSPYSFSVIQNSTNSGDTGDGALSVSHNFSGSGSGTELVTRSFIFGSNNSRTGGSVLTNARVLYLVSSTQSGTNTTNLDQVYVEGGTMSGTVTNNRGILVKTMQGTNQAAFVATGLTSANRVHLLLGNYYLPSGAWGIYSGLSDSSYLQGTLLLGSVTDSATGAKLQVTGSIQQSSVTSALLKASSTGVLTAAVAGTDYLNSASLTGYVPTTRTLSINGNSYDLSADRSWTVLSNPAARNEYTFIATTGQTAFTANYTVGQVDVYYNGSKLTPSVYTASSGTSITLGFACKLNDEVNIVAYITGAGLVSSRTLTINGISYDLSSDRTWTLTTANISEVTNLYYTDARVLAYLTANSYATQTYVSTAISNLVASSPATLDTLNELALALGSDPNFATTVATSIGTKQPQLSGTGFVKISGTTISYDNSTYLTTASASSTYLPLTGGTLTGALGGTSASFSGLITSTVGNSGTLLKSTNATTSYQVGVDLRNTGGVAQFGIESSVGGTFVNGSTAYASIFGSGNATDAQIQTNGTVRLSIASTGAATFSSSVTATNSLTINSTTNPIVFLNSTGTNQANGTVLQESGTNKWAIGSNLGSADGTFNIYNYGASARYLTIASTGAATFESTLRINGAGQSLLIFPTTTSSVRMQIQSSGGGNMIVGCDNSSGGDLATGTTTYSTVIGSGSTRDLFLVTNSIQRFKIDGTSGAATFSASVTSTGFAVANTGGSINTSDIGAYVSLFGATGSPANTVIIGTASTERMRITSAGNVGIAVTPSSGIRLQVRAETSDSSSQAMNIGKANGADLIYVRADGYLYSVGAWSGSDIRLKENIIDLENGLNKVLGLKAKKFDLIDGLKNNYGFIAQDVQEVIPDAVSVFEEKEQMLAIRMDYIIPHLVKAIQEQQQQIKELQSQINK